MKPKRTSKLKAPRRVVLHAVVRPLRERRFNEMHKPAVRHTGTVRAQAILDAANLASSYSCASTHSYDLGDCILAKLNLLSLRCKIRRNPCRSNTSRISDRLNYE